MLLTFKNMAENHRGVPIHHKLFTLNDKTVSPIIKNIHADTAKSLSNMINSNQNGF